MRCEAIKQDETRCAKEAPPGKSLCWVHDPANSETLKHNASKGGKARTQQLGESALSRELHSVRSALYEVIDALRDESIPPNVGAVVVQGFNAVIRTLAEERQSLGEEGAEARIAALEERMGLKEAA